MTGRGGLTWARQAVGVHLRQILGSCPASAGVMEGKDGEHAILDSD
jgi:hypothetical protein